MIKYYSNFCFEGYKPTQFHCTHLYFGELTNAQLLEVQRIIEGYFHNVPLYKSLVEFDERKMFGKEGNIPVLLLKTQGVDFHLGLRTKLEQFDNNDLDFLPHVTTDQEYFSGMINRYSLIQKDEDNVEELRIWYAV
jgi:hypothetical protein